MWTKCSFNCVYRVLCIKFVIPSGCCSTSLTHKVSAWGVALYLSLRKLISLHITSGLWAVFQGIGWALRKQPFAVSNSVVGSSCCCHTGKHTALYSYTSFILQTLTAAAWYSSPWLGVVRQPVMNGSRLWSTPRRLSTSLQREDSAACLVPG